MSFLRAIVIVVLMLAGFSGGKTAWDSYYPKTWSANDQVSGEIESAHTTILGITVNKHSLQDALKKFGRTAVFEVGSGESADQMICYVSQDNLDKTVIVFEVGPGEREVISSFIVTNKDYLPFCDKCAKSSRVKKGIATEGGITLGITKDRFMSIFGTPTEIIEPDGIAYRYIGKIRLTKKEIERLEKVWGSEVREDPYYYFISGIQAHFLDDKLIWFMVYKTDA